MNCSFCKNFDEIQRRIIGENECALAFLTRTPITHGHFLVISRRCVATFADWNDDEVRSIFSLMEEMKSVLKKRYDYKDFNHAWNQGKTAGQTVNHFHLHVVPRRDDDGGVQGNNVRKYLYRPGERDIMDSAEIYEIAQEIKS